MKGEHDHSELHARHAATLADLIAWRDHLVSWRKTLCERLLDRHIAVSAGSLPLHDLMRADGYDPSEWLGSLNTVEKLLKEMRP